MRLAPGEHPDYPEGHDDKTHFNADGARKLCRLVAREMKAWPELAGFLKEEI